jgi:serine phosphatase RsbU (regulator of sigma subunit)
MTYIPLPQPNNRYIFDEDDETDIPFQREFVKDDDGNISNPNYDKLLTAEVSLMVDEQIKLGKVTGCKRDADGNEMGKHNANPLFNTRLYEVTSQMAQCKTSQPTGVPKQYLSKLVKKATNICY